jgi:hypothetical protein
VEKKNPDKPSVWFHAREGIKDENIKGSLSINNWLDTASTHENPESKPDLNSVVHAGPSSVFRKSCFDNNCRYYYTQTKISRMKIFHCHYLCVQFF